MRLQDDLERIAAGMAALRVVHGLMRANRMAPKFSNAMALAGEIEKLYGAIEDDARKLITETIPAMHAKRKAVMAKGAGKIADAGTNLGAVDAFLDKLDEALGDNGGPTLGDSSGQPTGPQDSPIAPEPAMPKAGTGATRIVEDVKGAAQSRFVETAQSLVAPVVPRSFDPSGR